MKPKSTLRSFLALTGSSLLAISSASAQSNWTQTATGTQQWNTATNWSTNPTVPNGAGVVANLSLDLANTQTVNLATGVTLGSLAFGDTGSTFFAQTIQGSAITFNNSGSGATLTQAGAATGATGNISNNIVLNDNLILVNNGTSTDVRTNGTQLTGAISGTGGITINTGGGNGFALSNTGNTYSGGLTLNAANATVVTGSNSNAFGTGTITINAGKIDISSSGAASQAITTTNANVWNGNWTLAGAVSTGIWNNNGSVTLGANVIVTVSGGNFSLGGNIGQTGGARSLTLNGGVNTLSGTNNYTGGTSVGSFGTLNFINTVSMPSTGNVAVTNNTTLGIGLGGNGWTSTGTGAGTLAGIFDGTNVGVGAGSATLSYTSAVGLNLIVTGSHSFDAISNLGSGATLFTKAGIGSLTITGDNTYTGANSVIGGGALVLDYTSGNVTKFANTPTALTLGAASAGTSLNQGTGGGTITLKAGAQEEKVQSAALNFGGTFITRDTGTSSLRLNGIIRSAGGTISFADATIATTDTNNFGASGINGILGGWATVGNDWAVSANTGAADAAITALGSYTGFVNTGGSATTNYLLNGSDTLAGATAVGSLKITNSADSQSLDLGTNNLTITSTSATALGGLMYAGGSDNLYTISGGTGRIVTSATNQELIFAVQTGTLSVSALIGTLNGGNAVTKSGAATMAISAANSYSGALRVNEGVVRLANNTAAGQTGGGIVVQNGATLELSGGITVGNEALLLTGSGISNGGALRNISGANNYQGAVTVGIGGARINNDAGTLLTLTNAIATNGAGDVTFGGVGNTTVSTVGINGGGGLAKDGAGTLTLSARNSYVGNTTVSAGTLILADNAQLRFLLGDTSGTNNSLTGSGTATLDGDFFIDTSSADALSSGSWTLENVSTLTGPYGSTFTVVGFTDAGDDKWTKVVGPKTYTFDEDTGILTLTSGGGPGPLDNFLISAISSPQTVGTPITSITLTARDASNATVTSFTGTVNFSGTGGFTGTSASFSSGVLTGVSVTPTTAGSGLTFTVTDPVSGKFGTATFNIQTQYAAWSGATDFDVDTNGDGVKNGLAFLLGAANKNVSALNKLPTVTETAGGLVLVFDMLDSASRGSAALSVENSSDLGIGDPWEASLVPEADNTVNGVVFDIEGSGTLDVAATIPVGKAAGGKLFGRLSATP